MDWLRLTANIAFVNARYEEFRSGAANFAGNRPPNVPATVANLGVVVTPLPELDVGGFLHYRSAIFADDANQVRLPGAAIADVFATWRLAPQSDITFRVHNIADTVYAAWATDANYVILGRPRTFELTYRARF